ncbi:hypothetical protein ACKAV7_008422 [Fusarium commune]
MADHFSLFTSLRKGWNFENKSPLYMLDFHRDRLLRAATYWKWQPAIDQLAGAHGLWSLVQLMSDAVGPSRQTPLKLKIIVSREGNIKVEKSNTPEVPLQNLFPARLPYLSRAPLDDEPKKVPSYTLLVDQASTTRSEYTHLKTTTRAMYDAARQRAGISYASPTEVLIVNQDDGSVMEGTFTTPYFWRDGQWVTPPVAAQFSWDDGNGGQDGTSRHWALERGIASEQVVEVNSLVHGEECWISNGVRGFISATVYLHQLENV